MGYLWVPAYSGVTLESYAVEVCTESGLGQSWLDLSKIAMDQAWPKNRACVDLCWAVKQNVGDVTTIFSIVVKNFL